MADSRAQTILKGTGLAVAGTLFGLLLAAAIVSALSVTFFNYEIIVVKSGSMEPTYRKGDVVVVRPERMDKVKEGDVILFNEPNTGVPFVHRVIAMRVEVLRLVQRGSGELLGEEHKYYFRTQGDANRVPDSAEVAAKDYVGKVWFDVPTFGLLASGISPTVVLFGLSGLIGVGWVAYEILRRRRGSGTPAAPRRRRGRPLPRPASQDDALRSTLLRPPLQRRLRLLPRLRSLGGRLSAALRALRGGARRGGARAGGWLAQARTGSGILIAVPAALWVVALAVVFTVGARADVAKWVDSGWTGGQAQVYVPQPSPSPSPTEAAASPSPSPSPAATPTPSPSPSPSPSPTEDPTDEPSGTCDDPAATPADEDATPTPGATGDPCANGPSDPSEDETPTPTPTEDATEEPTEEGTPTPTEDATEEPTEEGTPTPTEDATEEPTEEGTPTPTEDATAESTSDPAETPDGP